MKQAVFWLLVGLALDCAGMAVWLAFWSALPAIQAQPVVTGLVIASTAATGCAVLLEGQSNG